MDLNITIAEIEARLVAANIGIDDFCASVGIHRATWQRWKRGLTSPTLETWRQVVAALPAGPAEGKAA